MFSVAILAKNSGPILANAIASVKSAPEIIVFDDSSTDNTAQVAKSLAVRVIKLPSFSSFAQKRNWAMERCAHDWVFFLDSDEQLQFPVNELEKLVQSKAPVAYSFHRHDILWGKPVYHGDNSSVLVRLVKKKSGAWVGQVHEKWLANNPSLVADTELVIRHSAISSLYAHLSKLNHYSTLRARELYQARRKSSIIQIIFLPIAKFTYLYLVKLGFLDGMPGLISAMCMSFYTFLTRAKLWSIYQKLPV